MEFHFEENLPFIKVFWFLVCFIVFVICQVVGWCTMLRGFWKSWELFWQAIGYWFFSFCALALGLVPPMIKVFDN